MLVHLPVLWGFWDGAAASYVWNRNVLIAVAKGWFIGIVIGVILPFVSSSGIFCPCSKQKINLKNPVEPVTCTSSEWGEVQWKLKQFLSGVRWGWDECRDVEFGLAAEELSEAAMPWEALGVTIPKPPCQRMRSTPHQWRGSGALRQEQEDRLVGLFDGGAHFSLGLPRVGAGTSSRSDLELPKFQVCRKAFFHREGKKNQVLSTWRLHSGQPYALVVSFWADVVLGLSALMQCICEREIKEWAGERLLE